MPACRAVPGPCVETSVTLWENPGILGLLWKSLILGLSLQPLFQPCVRP